MADQRSTCAIQDIEISRFSEFFRLSITVVVDDKVKGERERVREREREGEREMLTVLYIEPCTLYPEQPLNKREKEGVIK